MARKNKVILFILAFIIFLIIIFPVYWLFIGTLKESGKIFTYPPEIIPLSITFENYIEVVKLDTPIFVYFFNSMFASVFQIFGTLLLSAMAGYALAKYEFKGKKIIFLLIISGMFVPFQSLIIPLFLLIRDFNLFDTRAALFLPFIANPLGVFLMRQYLISVPDEIIESARIDGASDYRIFFQIVCPIIKPAFATLSIVTFVFVWNAFVWPLTVLRTMSKFTLPIWLNTLIQDPFMSNYGLIFAAAFLTLLPVLILYLVLQDQFISGLAAGSVD